MKTLVLVLMMLLVPLLLFGALYDFDTGVISTKLTTPQGAAAGHVKTVFYVPNSTGIEVDEKVTDVWGYISVYCDSGVYDVDTAVVRLQYYTEGAWAYCSTDIDSIKGKTAVHTGSTFGFDDLCVPAAIKVDSAGFSNFYRWEVSLMHDSAQVVNYTNSRIVGLNRWP